jgi:hypothetical protein
MSRYKYLQSAAGDGGRRAGHYLEIDRKRAKTSIDYGCFLRITAITHGLSLRARVVLKTLVHISPSTIVKLSVY